MVTEHNNIYLTNKWSKQAANDIVQYMDALLMTIFYIDNVMFKFHSFLLSFPHNFNVQLKKSLKALDGGIKALLKFLVLIIN